MNDLWTFSIITSTIIILGAIIAGLFLALFYPATRVVHDKEKDINKIGIKNIDRMDRDGKSFEHYLTVLFLALGYKNVHKTKDVADFGADLIFSDSKGNRTVVQAKNYTKGNKISNEAVQQVYASMPYYKATKAIIITSSSMTKACEEQAAACNVTIIARSDLIEMINQFKKKKFYEVKKIIERESRLLEYNPKDRLDVDPKITKSKITSGGYFYNLPVEKKTS